MVINNILAAFLLTFIYKSRRRISILTTQTNHKQTTSRREARDRKFTFNSLALNFVCFMHMLPTELVLLFSFYYSNWTSDYTQMMFTIAETVFTFQYANGFFVNIGVNSLFYDECVGMFGLLMKRRDSINTNNTNNTIHTNNNTRKQTIVNLRTGSLTINKESHHYNKKFKTNKRTIYPYLKK